jgi:GAF domain-containing protein
VTSPEIDEPNSVVQQAFDELGRMSFAEHSLESLLQRVTDLAARVVQGEPVTSVTIVRDGGAVTVAASGRLALELDETQYRLGAGPCLQAATTGRQVEVVDTLTEDRWTEFSRTAVDHGCRSVLSFPLPAAEQLTGGLNLYSTAPGVVDDGTRRTVERFTTYAVVAVSNMYLYRTAAERAEHLAAALDSRAVIDQAKGILMERFRMTADQAFQALAKVSMETNIKVREVAERFVATGEFPQG